MDYMDANDDLCGAVRPFKVVACLAVHGRLPLLEHTIRRLYQKNGCYKVVCSGDGVGEKRLCESLGAVFVPYRNKPLAAKWNAAFVKARQYHPDAVLYVGSSDWISDGWIPTLKPYVEQYNFVGVPGCSFLDIGMTMRAVNWKGYGEERKESIGIGRMLSSKLMEAINWQPFEGKLDSSMDGSMKRRAEAAGFKEFMFAGKIKALSISSNRWPPAEQNKHKFEDHYSNKMPSEKILDVDEFLEDFPEAYQIFK